VADPVSGFGELPADVVALIGTRCYEAEADGPAELAHGRLACASVANANPLFWDDGVAADLCGGPVLPPTTLSRWTRPVPWSPGAGIARPLQLHFDLKDRFALPEAVVSESELVLHEMVRPGDVIAHAQVLRSVSPPRTTTRGTGRFWVIDTEYRNQRGALVGVEVTTAFGFVPETRPGARASVRSTPQSESASSPESESEPESEPASRRGGARRPEPADQLTAASKGGGVPPMPALRWGDVTVGMALPGLHHLVTVSDVVLGAAAAGDWRPAHHDPAAARRGGAPDIFFDTPTQAAWFERALTDWSGPAGRLGRLAIAMRLPVVPGAVFDLSGTVTGATTDERACRWVEVALELSVGGRLASRAAARLAVPLDPNDNPWARAAEDWRP